MNKCIYKGIDIFNPLDGNMKYFVDAFTTVYGEKYRSVIEKRLSSAKYFFLGGDFDFIIKAYQQRQQEELDKLDTYKINKNLKLLKTREITNKYQHIINIFKKSKAQSEEIKTRYHKARINLLSNFFENTRTKNKLPALTPARTTEYALIWLDLLKLGSEKLKNNKILISEQKKEKYISLFKAMGYEAKDFEGYLKNKKLTSILFSKYVIETLINWETLQTNEENKANICTADLIEQLNELQIYGGNQPYIDLGTDYIKGQSPNSAFAVTCLSKTSSFTSLCFCKNGINLCIEDLTHEMGHIIDSFVVESNKQGFYHKCGFETHYYPLTPEANQISHNMQQSADYRIFELFNEMINEYICLQVAQQIKNSGKTIVYGERKGKSKYQFGFEIFEDFLKKYQQKLIDLKMQVDKQDAAQQYFGEQNLKDLALLAKSYIDQRSVLNLRAYNRDKSAFKEIESLKIQAKQKLAQIEQNIESHINQSKNLEASQSQLGGEFADAEELSA